jgi:phage terminase large subunit
VEITKTKVQIPEQFKELFNPSWRNIVYYGGRASLKSHSVARALLLRGREKKLRILCTRELQKSIKDSVHKLLADLIGEYGFDDYLVLKDSITNTVTGTEFIFLGLRLNVLEIKSLEGIDICWVEEAHAITEASIEVLTPTIRKEGSQIIWTFNRLNELDPVYVKYVMNNPPNTFAMHVNYDIALSLGWMPKVLQDEMEQDKNENPMLYAHKWLGEPLGQAEMSIIGRDQVLEAMQRDVEPEGAEEVGADIARMGNDRIVFWKRKGLTTTKTAEFSKLRTTETCDQLEQFVEFNKEILIKVDDTGVGGGVTDEMIKRGYNIMPINFGGEPVDKDKYQNWISEAWFYMAEIMPTIDLPFNSDLLMELSTRQWKQDTRGRRNVESKSEYKKRGFRSPDMADACIICYYTPVPVQTEWGGVR